MDERDYRLVKIFKAMGNGLRYRILMNLMKEERYVSELAEILDRDVSTISRQLRNLRNQDLVAFVTEGRKVSYRPKRPEILEKLFDLRSDVRRDEAENFE